MRFAALVLALAISGCASLFGPHDIAPNGLARSDETLPRVPQPDQAARVRVLAGQPRRGDALQYGAAGRLRHGTAVWRKYLGMAPPPRGVLAHCHRAT